MVIPWQKQWQKILGANCQKIHAVTNVFFCISNSGGYWLLLRKSLMPVTENCSLFTKQNQILPDAEFWCSVEYLLRVNIALLAVVTVCVDSGSALFATGRNVLCFQRLCSIWINRWKKLPMRWETFFIHYQTVVEHCQRFYNGLSNITNAFKTIINAL